MKQVTTSTQPLSETEGDLRVIVNALCYAVSIATDDVHKKYLAELVFRITNQERSEAEEPTMSINSNKFTKKPPFKIKFR